jgi:MFS transporter, ACS family, aldohexuronate transporter
VNTSAGERSPSAVHKYRFVILGCVWASYLIVYLTRLSLGPLAPFLKDAFSLDNAQIGTLTSATAITYAPAMIFAGVLADHIGVRKVIVAGLLLAGVCIALLFVVPSYPLLLVLLAVSGFGCGAVYPCAVKAIMLWFPLRERATALGFNQSAINVSGMVGALLLPLVAIQFGWQYGFLFIGITSLLIGLLCALFYRDPDAPACLEPGSYRSSFSEADLAADAPAVGDGVIGDAGWKRVAEVFRSRDIWLLCATGLVLGIVEFSVMAHLVLYLQHDLLYAVAAAGGLLALCQAAGAFGKPAAGFVSDRLCGGRRKPVFIGMSVITALVCVFMAATDTTMGLLVYPALIVFGIAAIGWGGLYGAMAGEIGGTRNAGVAAGVTSAVVNVGVIIGPPVFGVLVDATGTYRLSWIVMAVCAGLAVVTLALIREPRRGLEFAATPPLGEAAAASGGVVRAGE